MTSIAAGSPAAREGSLNIGDRLIAVSPVYCSMASMQLSFCFYLPLGIIYNV